MYEYGRQSICQLCKCMLLVISLKVVDFLPIYSSGVILKSFPSWRRFADGTEKGNHLLTSIPVGTGAVPAFRKLRDASPDSTVPSAFHR